MKICMVDIEGNIGSVVEIAQDINQAEGQTVNGYTIRKNTDKNISIFELSEKRYWDNGWKVRQKRPSSQHIWKKDLGWIIP